MEVTYASEVFSSHSNLTEEAACEDTKERGNVQDCTISPSEDCGRGFGRRYSRDVCGGGDVIRGVP